jgi:hypothetical protein
MGWLRRQEAKARRVIAAWLDRAAMALEQRAAVRAADRKLKQKR